MMAEVYYWLGDATETTAVVMARSDTAGTLTLTGATNDGPHAVDPATEFGVVKFTVSGLSADTSYPFTLLLDAVESASGTLRTMPTATGWAFGVASCIGQRHAHVYGFQYVLDFDVRAFFALGDTPYCLETISSATVNTVATQRWKLGAAVAGSFALWDTRAGFDVKFDYLQRNPGWEYLTTRVPTYRCVDNHEYGGIDWDWTSEWTTYNVTTNWITWVPAIATQADIDSCGAIAESSHATWMGGNPANADAEAIALAPSNCANADALHPPRYWRKTIGNVEFFMLDCFGHVDPHAKIDTPKTVCLNNATWNAALGFTYSNPAVAALAKTRLGQHQLNWLLTHLASSTATFKVILSSKPTRKTNQYTSNHAFDYYPTEIEYILAYIKKYVTGCMWVTGDAHMPTVINDLKDDHCIIYASPNSQADYLGSSGTRFYHQGYTDGVIYRAEGMESPTTPGVKRNSMTIVRVEDGYLKPEIYDENGTLLWTGYMLAGKNVLQLSLDWRSGEY